MTNKPVPQPVAPAAVPEPEFDWDAVDPTTIETSAPTYPAAQWHNGQSALKQLGGAAYTGGVVLPTRYLPDGASLPGFRAETITFRSGKDEAALTAPAAQIAVIRARFCWKKEVNGQTVFFPRSGYVAGAKMRGRLQVLCVVKGGEQPLTITFTGTASQHFENALKDFDQKVIGAANQTAPAGKRLPRFACWLTLQAGKHQKASAEYESIVTPPQAVIPEKVERESLKQAYVGKANLARFTELFHEAEGWAKAWDKPGAEQTPADEPPPMPDEEEQPF